VSRGYLNLPDKTAERWRRDPFVQYAPVVGDGEGYSEAAGEQGGWERGCGMMFNTGDLGRWREDGQLDHMGRADDQVKVKGFRVELDGVSAAMRVRRSSFFFCSFYLPLFVSRLVPLHLLLLFGLFSFSFLNNFSLK